MFIFVSVYIIFVNFFFAKVIIYFWNILKKFVNFLNRVYLKIKKFLHYFFSQICRIIFWRDWQFFMLTGQLYDLCVQFAIFRRIFDQFRYIFMISEDSKNKFFFGILMLMTRCKIYILWLIGNLVVVRKSTQIFI